MPQAGDLDPAEAHRPVPDSPIPPERCFMLRLLARIRCAASIINNANFSRALRYAVARSSFPSPRPVCGLPVTGRRSVARIICLEPGAFHPDFPDGPQHGGHNAASPRRQNRNAAHSVLVSGGGCGHGSNAVSRGSMTCWGPRPTDNLKGVQSILAQHRHSALNQRGEIPEPIPVVGSNHGQSFVGSNRSRFAFSASIACAAARMVAAFG